MANHTREKIMVFADVHGNLSALLKLKKTRDYKTSTKKIFLGDAVTMGADSKECLETILKDVDVYILGNHDSYVANGLPKEMVCSKRKIAHQSYIRSQVPEQLQNQLKTKPKELYIKLCGKTLYFTHYLWKSKDDVDDELEGDERTIENLDIKFKAIDADIIFHAHDHYPAHFIGKKKSYYIVGSLGMKIPAKYVVIIVKDNKLKIKHKTLKYNYKKVIKKMLVQNYPSAEIYAKFFKN